MADDQAVPLRHYVFYGAKDFRNEVTRNSTDLCTWKSYHAADSQFAGRFDITQCPWSRILGMWPSYWVLTETDDPALKDRVRPMPLS